MELKPDAIDKIYARLEKLKEYIGILEGLGHITRSELEIDPVKKGALERYLQLAIEACIDIAELIISDQRLPTPQTAREALELLGKHDILEKEFATSFADAAGFRNILIHDYLELDY